ncbi:antibiotic biosynthesis monooxygenase [Bacillus paralicheniformis]|uniref:antibiotic biosynthesis monooxygenase n=1 Tax=Bacillus paralicheniformis TaxID=1648923 RepID=UPI0011A59C18|nr:antibiotic biosynthesis monooxygenase [Bacillus paralicheniformis]TWK36035.1 Heme oxygenase (staphylobilin-producing) [Bacillus paralicheniformis]
MFISQACFEGDKTNEHKIIAKLQKTMNETINTPGLVSVDCWLKENKDRVEYVFVTKWESKDHFKTWVTREDHVEEHKEMNKQKQQGQQEEVKIKKTLRQYQVVDVTSL